MFSGNIKWWVQVTQFVSMACLLTLAGTGEGLGPVSESKFNENLELVISFTFKAPIQPDTSYIQDDDHFDFDDHVPLRVQRFKK